MPETVSARVREIYQRGLELGNNPQAYSKIGDCDASSDYFLAPFDGDPVHYSLGEYTSLVSVVNFFHGSHGRTSLASGIGYSTAAILAPFRADSNICETNETPLACEVRVHRPSFALVALGSDHIYQQDTFDDNMRRIMDYFIEKGVICILMTCAGPFFDDPDRMRSYAWLWRNLTALQTLESVWRGATANP